MAGSSAKFVRRLSDFLGKDTFVFPAPDVLGQPGYRVEEIAADLYDLRSQVAHGNEIPKKYRIAVGFKDESRKLIPDLGPNTQYREVLEECAVFLLCRALRKVFTDKLVEKVGTKTEWRRQLNHS